MNLASLIEKQRVRMLSWISRVHVLQWGLWLVKKQGNRRPQTDLRKRRSTDRNSLHTSIISTQGRNWILGSWIVKMLYDKGLTVHCTTRSSKKVGYVKALCPDSDRLKIFTDAIC